MYSNSNRPGRRRSCPAALLSSLRVSRRDGIAPGPAIPAALRSRLVDRHRRNAAGARVLALVNPNNPTGSFVKRGELERLSSLGIPIVSDEVFSDYAFAPDPDSHRDSGEFDDCLSFSLSGLSKVAGLPQMKLGWIVVNGPAGVRRRSDGKARMDCRHLSLRRRPGAMRRPQALGFRRRVPEPHSRADRIELALRPATHAGTAANILDVEGGWYATIRMPHIRSEEEYALDLFDRAGVLVQPGYFYDFESEAYLIVSLLTEEALFREGMARIRNLV